MSSQIEIKLLLRGFEKKSNNCVDLILPTNDEKNLKEKMELVCCDDNALLKNKCIIIQATCNCKIEFCNKVINLTTKNEILKLNKKLMELNALASPDEITAVSEYLDMKKSKFGQYTCKQYKGVTIDEIINKIKAKDYKFYTNEGYLDLFDNLTIYDKLNTFCEDEEEILSRINEHYDIYERFSTSEILNLFDNNELVEHFAENGCCIVASTGVIEETKKSITTLNISPTILEILDSNKIKTLDELTNKSEFELIKLNLNQLQTNEIEIALKEKGLKLKENV